MIDVLAVGLALWATAAAIGRFADPLAQLGVSNYWSAALIFVMTRSALATRQDFQYVGCAYLVGCAWASAEIIRQGVQPRLGVGPDAIRLGVDGVNVNYTSYVLAIGIAVAIALLKVGRFPKRIKVMIYLAVPVFVYATIGTGTRGAQISIVLLAIYLAAARWTPRVTWWTVVVGGPALLVAVALGIYGDAHLLWIQDYFGRATSDLSGRTNLWPLARAVWVNNLWTGIGPGMFPESNPLGIGAHSIVLTVGSELGILGALQYAVVTAAGLVVTSRSGRTGRLLVGLLLIACLPIWLSGTWEVSPAAWAVLALWTRLPLKEVTFQPGADAGTQRRGLKIGARSFLDAGDSTGGTSGKDFVCVGVDVRCGLIPARYAAVED